MTPTEIDQSKGPNGALTDGRPDLLTHKYCPTTSDGYSCHRAQATRLKQWIKEFLSGQSPDDRRNNDSDDSGSDTESSGIVEATAKCILITGPPGVGKTSLVYTVAKELKLHVVESHPSEKRDAKLFSGLRLANQKGKIDTNPIMKMFHAMAHKQQEGKRKRRKLTDSSIIKVDNANHKSLSLSDHSSIILFDDVDIVFDEDGPFLKSLVEFINESKRPVVVTATQSIDRVKLALTQAEHIHLGKPYVRDCVALLKEVCNGERLAKRDLLSKCYKIASKNDCDIRKCLNRIHFYGTDIDQINLTHSLSGDCINPEFTRLFGSESDVHNEPLLNCYTTRSIIDLMDDRLIINDSSTLRQQWLDGKPPAEAEYHSSDRELGAQIREAIINLTSKLHSDELLTEEQFSERMDFMGEKRENCLNTSSLINYRIRSRIEPPEKEFLVDIVPMFSELASMEMRSRTQTKMTNGSRRTRRSVSYLESIFVYLNHDEMSDIAKLSDELND